MAEYSCEYTDSNIRCLKCVFVVIREFPSIIHKIMERSSIPPPILYHRIQNDKEFMKHLKPEDHQVLQTLLTDGYNKLDLTLSFKILTHYGIMFIEPPTRGWSSNPQPHEVTIGDDAQRLRLIRNHYLHKVEIELSEHEFDAFFSDISSICERVDKHLNCTNTESFKIRIENFRTNPLIETNELCQLYEEEKTLKGFFLISIEGNEFKVFVAKSLSSFLQQLKEKEQDGNEFVPITLTFPELNNRDLVRVMNDLRVDINNGLVNIKLEKITEGSIVIDLRIRTAVLLDDELFRNEIYCLLKHLYEPIRKALDFNAQVDVVLSDSIAVFTDDVQEDDMKEEVRMYPEGCLQLSLKVKKNIIESDEHLKSELKSLFETMAATGNGQEIFPSDKPVVSIMEPDRKEVKMAEKYAGDDQRTFKNDSENLESADLDNQLNILIKERYGNKFDNNIHIDQRHVSLELANETMSMLNKACSQLKDDSSAESSCASCAKQRRVNNVTELREGQHIYMLGEHGTVFNKTSRKLHYLYQHHAIVKNVKWPTGSNIITMTLIHFSTTKDENKKTKYKVFEEEKEYDLNQTELYIVDYVHPRHGPEEIVKRAESILQDKGKFASYNPLTCNCEHFATWCVVGKDESFQVQTFANLMSAAVCRLAGMGVSKVFIKGILRFAFNFVDEISAMAGVVSETTALGTMIGIYLKYCIIMTVVHLCDYRNKNMCSSCLEGKLKDLWLTWAGFGLTSIMTFLFFTCLFPLMGIGVGVLFVTILVALSTALQKNLPKIRKALSSPFTVQRVMVLDSNMLSRGDIISFRYHRLPHLGIVSTVNTDSNCIRVIHYGASCLFGKRKIVEESINSRHKRLDLHVLDCKFLNTFSNNEVVRRARSRIGEEKWNIGSNRSDNFAYWAKVKTQYDEEFLFNPNNVLDFYSPKLPTISLFVNEREIHHHDDLTIGDVVKSSVIGLINDTGILESLKYRDRSNRRFEMGVITYSFSRVVIRKKYNVDMNTDSVFVKIYHQAQCHDMEQRAKNARQLIGQRGGWLTTEGFIRYCIEKKIIA